MTPFTSQLFRLLGINSFTKPKQVRSHDGASTLRGEQIQLTKLNVVSSIFNLFNSLQAPSLMLSFNTPPVLSYWG